MAENPKGAPFCQKCGMPIGMVATLDPIQVIYSTGWLLRRAISGGRWPMAFWGILLIFGPTTILYLLILAAAVRQGRPYGDAGTYVLFWVRILGVTVLYVAILWRVTKAYLRHLRIKPGHCEKCGYNLSHLPEPRCPECGTRFDPEDIERELAPEVAVDAQSEWNPPDTSDVPHEEYPIDCADCGGSLDGLGQEGECPGCGAAFTRSDRLFARYGPEVFVPDLRKDRQPRKPKRRVTAAAVLTAAALIAAPIVEWLVRSGQVSADCRVFVVIMFVVVIAEWYRASRPGS
jgi:hypothetical protein